MCRSFILVLSLLALHSTADYRLFMHVEWPESLSYAYEVMPSYDVGGAWPDEPMEQLEMVYANPPEACQPLTGAYAGRVVLMERGECTFSDKIRHAARAGAAVALVTESAAPAETEDSLVAMITDLPVLRSAKIPAGFVAGGAGSRFRRFLLSSGAPMIVSLPLNASKAHIPPLAPWLVWG